MKTVLSIFFLLIGLQLISQENSVHAQETTFKTAEEVEGLYFMHGTQINKDLCYISMFCEPGEVLSSDTLKTSFVIHIESWDSLLVFNGLEGAATKVRYLNYNGGPGAYTGECTSEKKTKDCASAELNGDTVTFFLESPSGAYYGEGIFQDNGLSVEGIYYYRGVGAEFYLEGTKIENER